MKVSVNFIQGAFIEIKAAPDIEYYIQFIDKDTDTLLHDGIIKNNMWIKCSYEYFINYRIKLLTAQTREIIKTFDFNGADKRIFITFESSSLGDSLGWIPFVEEFRIKHKCKIICSTFHNEIFKSEYPEIEFVRPGSTVNGLYAMYCVGCFDDIHKNKVPWNTLNNQEICSSFLGLEFKEIRPKILVKNKNRPISEKYVCISPTSTAGAKLWNAPNGWETVIEYLLSKNIKVVILSQENKEFAKLDSKVIYPYTKNIHNLIQWINGCEFHIGLCSGNSWLAFALNKKTIMIGGFSHETTEFYTPHRIINKNVCYGCWNDTRYKFDKADWNWCPRLKETERTFECSKQIGPELVIGAIDSILDSKN